MRLKAITVLMILLIASASVSAEDFSGWFRLDQNNTRTEENGEKISSTDTFQRNLYLNLSRSLTRMIAYNANLRVNYRDFDDTDENDETTTTYDRSIEPTIDLTLHNPMYDLNLGYQRREQWSTAHLNDDSRETDVFYYSRFSLTPTDLPSLIIDLERDENFDYLSPKTIDRTTDSYSISSFYVLPSRTLELRYNINFDYTEERDRVSVIEKTINEGFNANYDIGYNGSLWKRQVDYRVSYRGNYSRNKNESFVSQTGSFLLERSPIDGLYALSTDPLNKEVDVLSSRGALADDDTIVPAGINLSTVNEFHNLGIWVSPDRNVDRLYIYVNQDVTGAGDLNTVGDWTVQRSNANALGTWNNVSISGVSVSLFDNLNSIYRYEIIFASPQKASFFKAVNQTNAITANVEVTEVEAYGTDTAETNVLVNVSTFFSQGLVLTARMRPLPSLTVALNYSLDRRDNNPPSVPESMSGLVNNIFSDSIHGDNTNFVSDIRRNYGATATWLTHRLLTTVMRFQRSENFDNIDETDTDTNSYGLSFQSQPLTTVNTTLSLTRIDQFDFNEKESTNDSVVLSIDTRLYRDVNMVNDFGYTKTKSFFSQTETETYFINGMIDATITRRMSGSLNYDYSRTSSDSGTTSRKGALMILNYNPGRFINLTGRIDVSESEGEWDTLEGIIIDWLPVPVLRLSLSYQHSELDSDESTNDAVNSSVIWYIKRFLDIRTTYTYTRRKQVIKTEDHNLNTTLNCRF